MTTEDERKLARELIRVMKALQPSRTIVNRQLVERVGGQSVSIPLYNSSSISESRVIR